MSAEQPPNNSNHLAQAPPPYDGKSSPYLGHQQVPLQQPQQFVQQPQQFVQQPQQFVQQPQQFAQQPQQFAQQPQQVTVQVNTMGPVRFGAQSALVQCPACQYTGYTRIHQESSGLAWMLCLVMGVLG